ncbi:hypothetical protein [Myceligenerans pegani]|uniref:Uncharacterized protein n=1 Tax=Myceligenerans pegani TaxID=2776917 RepID=A0ABR9MUD6_9MICO|nr:hypothetical protein [Myceligenerans sp. TRM 65318]MBE1874554.1 hypothetical protein [Myceligenerans sp. TRM 65318]MBE3016825.1 hypothetical protein [Myceligenerans sp. TRM 65318]
MSKDSQGIGEWIYGQLSALVVGAGALVVTMLCVGGAVALMVDERPPYQAIGESETVLIPAIVTEDTILVGHDVPPGSVDRLLGESRTRSAETIEAGEVVYAAAGRSVSTSPEMLRRLRGALDEASRVLEEDLPDGASQARRERRIEELESRRTSVLEAAAVITQVRRVPAEDLPEGVTTLTDPVIEMPEEPDGELSREPSDEPSPEPSDEPSADPSGEPSGEPSDEPSGDPSGEPTEEPGDDPSDGLSGEPSEDPTGDPTSDPTPEPTSDTPSGGGLGLFDEQAAPSDGPTD